MQWWSEGKIVLCFDWGKFWLNSLIQKWEQTEKAEWEKNFINPDEPLPNGIPNLSMSDEALEIYRKKRKSHQGILNSIKNSGNADRLVVPRYGEMSVWWGGGYPDPTPTLDVRPYGIDSKFKQMNAPHLCETCDQGAEHWATLRTALSHQNLILPKAEAEKVYGLLFPNTIPLPDEGEISSPIPSDKKRHGNSENNAQWRERVLLAAGYVKFKYPDDCKNTRGKESCSAWASALIDHWHLFGSEGEAPSTRVAEDIIRDIFKLPAKRTRAGKNTP